jgi:hypothetical protein
MPKRISMTQLGRGGLTRAILAAQHEPILISELNHPVAWLVSAEALARVAAQRGVDDAYESLLELLGMDLNRAEKPTLDHHGSGPPPRVRTASSDG